MTKAPRRSVSKPGGGGALRVQPRSPGGQFAAFEATDVLPSPAPPRAPTVPCATRPASRQTKAPRRPAATTARLVTRVTRVIERELEDIENIVGGTPTESEKRSRRLALLARTLAEVTRLRSAASEARRATRTKTEADHDDNALPRDLDEFRRTLERRLARMADAGEISLACGDERE